MFFLFYNFRSTSGRKFAESFVPSSPMLFFTSEFTFSRTGFVFSSLPLSRLTSFFLFFHLFFMLGFLQSWYFSWLDDFKWNVIWLYHIAVLSFYWLESIACTGKILSRKQFRFKRKQAHTIYSKITLYTLSILSGFRENIFIAYNHSLRIEVIDFSSFFFRLDSVSIVFIPFLFPYLRWDILIFSFWFE